MRTWWICMGVVGLGSLLLAAAGVEDHPRHPPLPPHEAQNYARQLLGTADVVAEDFFQLDAHGSPRLVSRAELIQAGLRGLFDAARSPLPPTLLADIERTPSELELLSLITRARESLGNDRALKGDNALRVSFESMTGILDPFSLVVSGEELAQAMPSETTEGVGLELAEKLEGGPLVVQAVIPGGPAQRADLRPGDQITSINGQPAEDLTSAQGQLLFSNGQPLVQPDGGLQRVDVTWIRPGTRVPHKAILTHEEFQPETVFGVRRKNDQSWDYWVDRENKIAQVRLGKLGKGTAETLAGVLTNLRAEGMRGLILDLRWSPGGFLVESAQTARLFLGKHTIATLKGVKEQQMLSDVAPEKFLDFPILVLVNGETSGGAELIAAALQDNHRAVVAGQRTVGKASVQNLISLPVNNTGMKVTSGAFFRPNGKNMQRFPDSQPDEDWGVRPDPKMELRVSPELSKQLGQWWLWQTLRPADSNEALPLDDPEADPQRQTGLQILLHLIQESRDQRAAR
ncbi:MAG: PDZ domain-containing protein [Planctomycetes bacterium]|nr:PDZ domain-containing protein [Planctomycetota bacterium]